MPYVPGVHSDKHVNLQSKLLVSRQVLLNEITTLGPGLRAVVKEKQKNSATEVSTMLQHRQVDNVLLLLV